MRNRMHPIEYVLIAALVAVLFALAHCIAIIGNAAA